MFLGQSDIVISPIILGTWQAGKDMWVDIEDDEIVRAIQASVSCGVTSIDTAPIYGNGYSEMLIGKALASIPRQSVQILSKVFPTHLRKDQVIASCEQSLKRLKTDYLDLLQVHWPSGSFGSNIVPLQETLSAFNQLLHDGKIRAIGLSNFNAEQVAFAQEISPIASNQPPYSVVWRQSEPYVINYCQKHRITTLAYSSLAQGLLTDRTIDPSKFDPIDNRRANKLFQPSVFPVAVDCISRLKEYATGKQLSVSELALGWITSQQNCAAIVGARNTMQAEQNAQALSVSFSADEIDEIDQLTEPLRKILDSDPVLWQ